MAGSLPGTTAESFLSFVEGDVFRGSRRMPFEDLLTCLPDEYIVPGLAIAPMFILRKVLRQSRQSKQTLDAVVASGAASGVAGVGLPLPPVCGDCGVSLDLCLRVCAECFTCVYVVYGCSRVWACRCTWLVCEVCLNVMSACVYGSVCRDTCLRMCAPWCSLMGVCVETKA